MAGLGPAPKPAGRRARRNSNQDGIKLVRHEACPAPDLPEDWDWPVETQQWWQMWKDSPLTDDYTATDWSFLLDTAILHAKLWGEGDITVLSELRIRVAKFGATPEDRARLRIQFATADDLEGKNERRQTGAASRARAKKTKQLKVVS